jgi:hypothetical protein
MGLRVNGKRSVYGHSEYPSYSTDRQGPAGGIRFKHYRALHRRRWVEDMIMLVNSSSSISTKHSSSLVLLLFLTCSDRYPHQQLWTLLD